MTKGLFVKCKKPASHPTAASYPPRMTGADIRYGKVPKGMFIDRKKSVYRHPSAPPVDIQPYAQSPLISPPTYAATSPVALPAEKSTSSSAVEVESALTVAEIKANMTRAQRAAALAHENKWANRIVIWLAPGVPAGIDPRNNVSKLAEQYQKLTTSRPPNMTLSFKGRLLDLSKTISEQGLTHNDMAVTT
ncbi:hypothetical protein BDV97DRAFT_401316 [Delphinella strobiligena]|nr:hypothetical protein BDV97DRAFT_401316 [Delphinella strobiligena]